MRDQRGWGRIKEGRSWRTSTAVPNAVCAVAWVPIRLLSWLVRAIAALMRTVILAMATLVGMLLVISGAIGGWQESALGIVCLVCAGAVVFLVRREDWQRR